MQPDSKEKYPLGQRAHDEAFESVENIQIRKLTESVHFPFTTFLERNSARHDKFLDKQRLIFIFA
jgi:hypothetical protein